MTEEEKKAFLKKMYNGGGSAMKVVLGESDPRQTKNVKAKRTDLEVDKNELLAINKIFNPKK